MRAYKTGGVEHHLARLAGLFDAAEEAIKTQFPFASEISDIACPIAINGSLNLVERATIERADGESGL